MYVSIRSVEQYPLGRTEEKGIHYQIFDKIIITKLVWRFSYFIAHYTDFKNQSKWFNLVYHWNKPKHLRGIFSNSFLILSSSFPWDFNPRKEDNLFVYTRSMHSFSHGGPYFLWLEKHISILITWSEPILKWDSVNIAWSIQKIIFIDLVRCIYNVSYK